MDFVNLQLQPITAGTPTRRAQDGALRTPRPATARFRKRTLEPVTDSSRAVALTQHELGTTRWEVWKPVATKSIGVFATLLGLAAVGHCALSSGPGIPHDPADHSVAQRAATTIASWLAPPRQKSQAAFGHQPGAGAHPAGAAAGLPSPSELERTSHSGAGPVAPSRRTPTSKTPTPAATPLTAPSDTELTEPAGPVAPPGVTADGKIIINTASASELEQLPGVGAKRAAAIIKLRTRMKKFRRATDLLRVRGIGVRTLRRMLPLLVVDPPAPESPAPE